MINQIKTCTTKAIIGGYSICACQDQLPFALISDDEDTCKTICCETMLSDSYNFNGSEERSCSGFCRDFDLRLEFSNDKKTPSPVFETSIDYSWF